MTMRSKDLLCIAMFTMGLYAPFSQAQTFMSVKENGMLLFQSPALKAKKMAIYSRYYPVAVLGEQRDWTKVQDARGVTGWMPSDGLSRQTMLLALQSHALVYQAANLNAPVCLVLAKGAVVEKLTGMANGWIKVRHRNGVIGYVRASDFWGA